MKITDYNLVGYYVLLEVPENKGKIIKPTLQIDAVFFKVAAIGKNVTAAEVGEEVMLHPTITRSALAEVVVDGKNYLCGTEMDLFLKKPFTKVEDGELAEEGTL